MPQRLQRNLVNTVWVQAPSLAFGFFLAILLNRLLGPEGKGIYTVFDSTARFLVSLFGFNLGAAIIYFHGAGTFPSATLWRWAWRYIALVVGLSALAAGGLYAWNPRYIFFPSALYQAEYALYYLLWVPLAVGEYLFRSLLHGQKRIDRANLVLLLVKGLRLLVLLGAVLFLSGWAEGGLVGFLLIANGVLILLALGLMAVYSREENASGATEAGIPAEASWRSMFRYAAFLQLGAVLQFLNYKFDHWVILYFWGNEPLGWYSAATDVAQMIWLPSNVALLLLFPYLSDAGLGAEKKRRLFLGFIRVVSTLSILGMLFVLVVGEGLVVFLFGEAFAASGRSLRILIVGMAALNLARTHTVWLTATDQTRYVFYATGIAFLCTLVLDLALIPWYGIAGAAWATTIALAVMTAYHLWLSHAKFGIPLGQTFWMTRRDWKQLRERLAAML